MIAVVGKDGPHQVLADVVHVAVNRGQHHRALGGGGGLVQELFHVGHGPLHGLGGLEHEGKDQLARAELFPDLLHGGQEARCSGSPPRTFPS